MSLTFRVGIVLIGSVALAHDVPAINIGKTVPPNIVQNHVAVTVVPMKGGEALEGKFETAEWPNVYFTSPPGGWDWSPFAGLAVDVYNPERQPFTACMRVDNDGADGTNHCIQIEKTAKPGEWVTLRATFIGTDRSQYWGMRGIPEIGPVGNGASIDPAKIVAFQIFLSRPDRPHALRIRNIRLIAPEKPDSNRAPFPFIDKYGQYTGYDWPGKVFGEDDLKNAGAKEARSFAHTQRSDRDRFGGLKGGHKLDATGWFRVKKVNGVWWMVTPEGHLFLSEGVDCVNTGEQTFVDQRENWFAWLPEQSNKQFGPAWGFGRDAHSMASRIGGSGHTFSFYCANLIRKYGDTWADQWRTKSYDRLRSWGFTTVANWSQWDVLENSAIPFTACGNVSGDFRRVEGGGGYWGKMPDAYDPKFAEAAERCLGPLADHFANNPLCIGYFVDNELAWEALNAGILASPVDQPCRRAAMDMLRHEYGDDIANLNRAWSAQAADWDSVRKPEKPSDQAKQDIDVIVHDFAAHYFTLIRDALRKHAPHQLYLGCRFAGAPAPAVKAAAEICDVVSFNKYKRTIKSDEFADVGDAKPVVIGEFHFGARDRGMFHPGLVETANQKERAKAYAAYVESALGNPAVIGCHWFQYVDEPTTGRWYDGENYNIGFVTVADTPYPEMVKAAKRIHTRMYKVHSQATPGKAGYEPR